ncbi:flagellar biosynthesis protein FlhA [uncultured Abyssibacter sp.]|uniref:flagellar biosynthesis protein FlhA n=1 Tax=uncultured Abyssibacter sp. TaxID=2320202 RepID=UPI0032B1B869
MAESLKSLPIPASVAPLLHAVKNGLAVPLLVMVMLAMMVVPLAPLALDGLFTFNIALSICILLAVIYVMRPLDFSVFPSILLVVTLLRLALNVASTRVVLLNGHEGPGAAGNVIEAFGNFVIGGNYAVGIVVFIILTIINFVVVTKGAERISEVSARFTLDSMPGKQMAIDADLNAGLLSRDEAIARREEVREEADFYGSMDGASKFVRGDALAGVLILLINLVGGLGIGMLQHGLDVGTAMQNYTLLTIGDGLVAQLPSLLLATAVAMLVTRMSRAESMGNQVSAQVFAKPQTLIVTAVILVICGLIPGMPNLVFLTLGGAASGLAWWMHRRSQAAAEAPPEPIEADPAADDSDVSWEDVRPTDALSLEVGYRLIPLVDIRQGGELVRRIRGVRKKSTHELGFLVPAVHIRDNLELPPNGYRLCVNGVPVSEEVIHADRLMALNPGQVFGQVEGIKGKDPAFGMEAVWIEQGLRTEALSKGWTVVDPGTVVATHIGHVVHTHAHELLGHDDVQNLLENLAKSSPKLVEDLVPKLLPLTIVVRVLQNLLEEDISIRAFKQIAESLAEHARQSQDPDVLTAQVRVALGNQIVQEINGLEPELPVLTLAQPLEQLLQESMQQDATAIEPGLAERMHQSIAEWVERQQGQGQTPVLLVPQMIRASLARFLRYAAPGLHVLAYNEVPQGKQLKLVGAVGA